MRKIWRIICFAAVLAFFAGCTEEAFALEESIPASYAYRNSYTLPGNNVYASGGAVSVSFRRFMTEVDRLVASAPRSSGEFQSITEKQGNLTIDIIFPISSNPVFDKALEDFVASIIDNFSSNNTDGYLVARGTAFRYDERFFGAAMDIRSYGSNDGFGTAKYVMNFDLREEKFIDMADVFMDDSDFEAALTDILKGQLPACCVPDFAMFNFTHENIYLYIDTQNAPGGLTGFLTLSVPISSLGVIWKGDAPKAKPVPIAGHIALTFDDGPHPTNTPALLDALKERGIRATFFVLGSQAERYPHIVARMHTEGHIIGNHSFGHPILTNIGRNRVIEELERTSNSIEEITGVRPTLLRPPYGIQNQEVRDIARDMGMSVIIWSVDPEDWRHRNADTVFANVLNSTNDGSVVLLHDVWPSTIEATIRAVDAWIEKGFAFVTVDELFELNALALEAGVVYHSVYHTVRRLARENENSGD